MTFTSQTAKITWAERRIRTLDDHALRLCLAGQKEAARKINAERDALADRFIALGGTYYQLGAPA
jgi:hypothetical protein